MLQHCSSERRSLQFKKIADVFLKRINQQFIHDKGKHVSKSVTLLIDQVNLLLQEAVLYASKDELTDCLDEYSRYELQYGILAKCEIGEYRTVIQMNGKLRKSNLMEYAML